MLAHLIVHGVNYTVKCKTLKYVTFSWQRYTISKNCTNLSRKSHWITIKSFFGNFMVPKKLLHQKRPKMAIFGISWPFSAMYGVKSGRYWQEISWVGWCWSYFTFEKKSRKNNGFRGSKWLKFHFFEVSGSFLALKLVSTLRKGVKFSMDDHKNMLFGYTKFHDVLMMLGILF